MPCCPRHDPWTVDLSSCLGTIRMEGLDVGVGDAKSSTEKLKIPKLF